MRGQAGMMEVRPNFINLSSRDIMLRDGDFVAVWNPKTGLWSKHENDVIDIIDNDVFDYVKKSGIQNLFPRVCRKDSDGVWRQYRQWSKNMIDTDHPLDRMPVFKDTILRQEDHVSYRLPYSLEEGEATNWSKLVDTLYDPSERQKIEWTIGSVLTGDCRTIDKFMVFYGDPGSGKSTILNVMQRLFGDFCVPFDSETLALRNNSFALSAFADDPLVAIEHDGDLSRIETNTRLNSIVSNEIQLVNEKFKKPRSMRITTTLIMASNSPVKITDANSGIPRRLLDVSPSGRRLPIDEYTRVMDGVYHELGIIAKHCIDVYRSLGPNYYRNYRSKTMISETNPVFNFVSEMYSDWGRDNKVTLAKAYSDYKDYADETGIQYRMPRYRFKTELGRYFREFHERVMIDGVHYRSLFIGFQSDKFESREYTPSPVKGDIWLDLKPGTSSVFDEHFAGCKAQYSSENGTPQKAWKYIDTTLGGIVPTDEHYVLMPEEYVCIDFDLKGDNGEKDLNANFSAASAWPPTYAETSKSGAGIHLIYRYPVDKDTLAEYSPGIEIKRFRGNASLRRRLSLHNGRGIEDYPGDLPTKATKMINKKHVQDENHLRSLIAKALRKEVHANTAPNVDFIKSILDEAYESGITYDVTDSRNAVTSFAMSSTNQSDRCLKMVQQMHFMSEDKSEVANEGNGRIAFYDVEVFPNLFVVCYKIKDQSNVRFLVNPSAKAVKSLFDLRLIGFNNRKYDNHIMYAASLGYSNAELFEISQRIINNEKNATFREAYNLSYTDIYDFSTKKQSLKKWEIELGIKHQENNLPWDQPVPEDQWDDVVEYCKNDVEATEIVFEHLASDWGARKILAELSGLSVNDTTNQHTCALVFGKERRPDKSKFVYTDLSEIFPGYTFDKFKGSSYRGEDPGEGGYVYSEPGYYENVALLDVASMHPTSIEQLNLFGPYTQRYSELKQARVAIKHKDMDALSRLFDGRLVEIAKNYDLDELGKALKIPINSMYGLTSAKFDNPAWDPRNVDNIVAKRGALFMIDLKHYVQDELGLTVAHIKTDSIKIPGATPDDIQKVVGFAKRYGYDFEHEATYAKMCLVNKAVYIAKYAFPHEGEWTATGKQFQEPYVLKKLFTKEPIEFEDYVQTKQVKTAMYLKFPDGAKHFVGKVGAFVPIKPDRGGAELLRMNSEGEIKDAVVGTKGYRWKEAEMVRFMHQEQDVDTSYAEMLADEAKQAIEQFVDLETLCR
nr:MAG TPA: DNA helicase [Caudoviricetes sp.]